MDDLGSGLAGYLYHVDYQSDDGQAPPAFPSLCPRCDADWRRKGSQARERSAVSPLSTYRTGFQRINQLLADALLREMESDEKRKLIIFTDSRQDAAKLAAGIELDHYRDLLRQALVQGGRRLGKGLRAMLKRFQQDPSISPEEIEEANRYGLTHAAEQQILTRFYLFGESSSELSQQVERLRSQLAGPYSIVELQNQVLEKLLSLGCNPGGPKPSRQHTWGAERSPWHQIIEWTQGSPVRKTEALLTLQEQELWDMIISSCQEECIYTLFAHNRKSAEALSLGWVTFNPMLSGGIPGVSDDQFRPLVDVTIRIMGERGRFVTPEFAYPSSNLHTDVRKYLEAVTDKATAKDWFQGLANYLRDKGLVNEDFKLVVCLPR